VTDLDVLAHDVRSRLLENYGQPEWRSPLPPIDELVSTILSQNTTDANRDRAFDSLRSVFPSWEEVRDGESSDVIEAIRTAGLANQKGPRIQEALKQITLERGELELDFLNDLSTDEASQWLQGIKGVGPKTAAIVLLFSMGQPAFPVDTHVYRVTGRLGLRPEKMSVEKAHIHLETLFAQETYYDLHLNLIRHGRERCIARNPECSRCFMNDNCGYYRNLPDNAKP
jgi:endonuclease-3